jgi:hypothetical protein
VEAEAEQISAAQGPTMLHMYLSLSVLHYLSIVLINPYRIPTYSTVSFSDLV